MYKSVDDCRIKAYGIGDGFPVLPCVLRLPVPNIAGPAHSQEIHILLADFTVPGDPFGFDINGRPSQCNGILILKRHTGCARDVSAQTQTCRSARIRQGVIASERSERGAGSDCCRNRVLRDAISCRQVGLSADLKRIDCTPRALPLPTAVGITALRPPSPQ